MKSLVMNAGSPIKAIKGYLGDMTNVLTIKRAFGYVRGQFGNDCFGELSGVMYCRLTMLTALIQAQEELVPIKRQ